MTDYSWMKPGVKVICKNHILGDLDQAHNDIYTLSTEPFKFFGMDLVKVDEVSYEGHFGLHCRFLHPYKEDDDEDSLDLEEGDQNQMVSWEQFKEKTGISIGEPVVEPEYYSPLKHGPI